MFDQRLRWPRSYGFRHAAGANPVKLVIAAMVATLPLSGSPERMRFGWGERIPLWAR